MQSEGKLKLNKTYEDSFICGDYIHLRTLKHDEKQLCITIEQNNNVEMKMSQVVINKTKAKYIIKSLQKWVENE